MIENEDLRRIGEESEEELESPVMVARSFPSIRGLFSPKYWEELRNYLFEEIDLASAERRSLLEQIERHRIAYMAPIPDEPKHFPIFNASNLTVPVIKEAVNTIAAQVIQATLTVSPRWVLKDLSKDWEPFVDDIEEFLDTASKRDMPFEEECTKWIIEMVKLGTGILEVSYDFEERKVLKYSEDGTSVFARTVKVKDSPTIRHVPLERFWIRDGEMDLHSAPWIAVEYVFHGDSELVRWLRQKGFEDEVESILRSPHGGTSRPEYQILKVWVRTRVNDEIDDADVWLYLEPNSRTIIGPFTQIFDHGKRPFVKAVFFPREDSFYGEGICSMLEQLQIAISDIANRRADNATLANVKMIVKKPTVKGIKPGDPIYSGKTIETQDPFRDIREFSFSDIYPSTVLEEQTLQKRAERLAGINEGVVGAAMPVTRTTASAQLALLQEQLKRIDIAIRQVRAGLKEVGRMVLDLYYQFGTSGKAIAWMGDRGYMVERVFSLPRRFSELGDAIELNVPTSIQNRQVKRENKIALLNLLVQLHKELIPFAQAFAPEQMGVVAGSLVKSAIKYLEDTLETFEETDIEGVLAGLMTLEKILPKPEDLGGLESYERAALGAEITEKIQRLESSLRAAEAARMGGKGVSDQFGEVGGVSREKRIPEWGISAIGAME